MAVRNYAPELLALYQQAASAEIRIPLATESQAIAYRHRLHNLRKAMRNEQHHLLPLAESVSLHVEHEGEGDAARVYLVARPADTGLVEAIRSAGVKVTAGAPPLPPPTPSPAPPTDPFSDSAAASALDAFKDAGKAKPKSSKKGN